MAQVTNLVLNKLHPTTGEDLKPTTVTTWQNGTAMTDALCGGLYNKDTEPSSPTNGSYFKWNGKGAWPISRLTTVNQSNFQKLINDFGATKRSILIDTTVNITSNMTIPSNIKLRFENEAYLNISAGITVTINSPLPYSLQQYFSTTALVNLVNNEIHAEWWGCKGDGVTDDIIPLQTFVSYCVKKGVIGKLRGVTYAISDVLNVGTVTTGSDGGFVLKGTNAQYISGKGTRLLLTTTGKDTILAINKSALRYFQVKDMTLQGGSTLPANDVYAAEAGIKFTSSEFSGATFENIICHSVRNCIDIRKGSGLNGEFTRFKKVVGRYTQKFLYMAEDVGQAYQQAFDDCYWFASYDQGSPEYVAFEVGGVTPPGFGLSSKGFNSSIGFNVSGDTLTPTEVIYPTIFLRNKGVTSTMNISGGRNEGYTTIYDNRSLVSSTQSIMNVDFAALYSSDNAGCQTITSTSTARGTINIDNCVIPIRTGFKFINSKNVRDNAQYIFRQCNIRSYNVNIKPTYDITVPLNNMFELRMEDCVDRQSTDEYVKFNKTYRHNYRHQKALDATNDMVHGVPSQLIKSPTFNATGGNPDWTTTGSFVAYLNGYGAAGTNNFSSLKDSKRITIAPGWSAFQDVYTVSAIGQRLYWNIRMAMLNSNYDNFINLTLSNPDNGYIYEIIRVNGVNIPTANSPVFCDDYTLQGLSNIATGKFRITIEAPATNPTNVTLCLESQNASNIVQSSYLSAVETYKHSWGSQDFLRVHGRLALPVVDIDTAFPDLKSDIALSPTDGSLNYYSGTEVKKVLTTDLATKTTTYTASGNGTATTINIPHSLGYTPTVVGINPNNLASVGAVLTADGTNFILNFATAPAAGTNNLSYNITYKK